MAWIIRRKTAPTSHRKMQRTDNVQRTIVFYLSMRSAINQYCSIAMDEHGCRRRIAKRCTQELPVVFDRVTLGDTAVANVGLQRQRIVKRSMYCVSRSFAYIMNNPMTNHFWRIERMLTMECARIVRADNCSNNVLHVEDLVIPMGVHNWRIPV